nr:hypothetical protein [Steroidobacter agaridevorans]
MSDDAGGMDAMIHLAVVDVQIGAAQPDICNAQCDFIRRRLRHVADADLESTVAQVLCFLHDS